MRNVQPELPSFFRQCWDVSCTKQSGNADLAHREWKLGKKVLIHCQGGLNRSGIVTALVLLKEGCGPKVAISLLRARRSPHALCNADFVRYLENLTVESNV